ncbi:MAG: beta-galactosidase [Filifactoraceae bacterium]
MYFGVDYYPEQWDINMIDEDMANIVELNADVIRIGEFAWTLMEKEEGVFNFDFFDIIISKAKSYGLKVIFGTPTATMPSWVASKYPDTLSEFSNGKKRVFGGRRQYCFNSKEYHRLTKNIVSSLAEHYKDEKTIIAWQIDNEFGHEGSDKCYCNCCKVAFIDFLRKVFNNDIEELNKVMGTVFWNQTYGSFDEVPIPLPTITTHNPSLRMYWERFRSESIKNYCKIQYELLKSILGNESIIIHDFSGGYFDKSVDFSRVAEHIDKVAYNNYPVWGGQESPIPNYEIACGLDFMRGLKKTNFWITEAIMGAQGHDDIGYLPRPNQAIMWSNQAVARGCETLIYFRYRGFVKGAEQFCYGIIDQDNMKRRKFYEVKKFFGEIKAHEKLIKSPVESKVAIIYDYDSMAAFRIQRQSASFDYKEQVYKMYKPFFLNGVNVDVIPSSSDFSNYEMVLIPSMIVFDEGFQSKLKAFVKKGKVAVIGFRSAVKDKYNNLKLGQFNPTYYTDLIGGRVEEIESLGKSLEVDVVGKGKFADINCKAKVFRDMIKCDTANVLFTYEDKYYKDFAAVTVNEYGNGFAYYIGTSLEDNVMEAILREGALKVNINFKKLPEGLEMVERKGATYYINHSEETIGYGNISLEGFESKIIYNKEE